MKVSELPYRRVTREEMTEGLQRVIERVKAAQSVEEILAARAEYLSLTTEYATAQSLSYMRYTINTVDPFYLAEKDYYDEIGPEVENLALQYTSAVLDSPFREALEAALSPILLRSMELQRRSMSPKIINDMVEENKIVSEYAQLMAGMLFPFRGEQLPRPMLMKYARSADRATRRECYEALGTTLEAHSAQLDDIFDRLVHVRDRMAKKMGYQNFIELGYCRMERMCYDAQAVQTFRENIVRDIVPVVSRLRLENAKRLGIDTFRLYDNEFFTPGGDPTPCGKEELFAAAQKMYDAMGDVPGAFFRMMCENEAFDVESRPNKWGGGYCTEFPKFRQPFILANFNGTSGDVDVVTHEAGHALNAYLIADNRFALELGCGGDRRDALDEHGVFRLAVSRRFLPEGGRRGALPLPARARCAQLPALRHDGGRIPAPRLCRARPHPGRAQRRLAGAGGEIPPVYRPERHPVSRARHPLAVPDAHLRDAVLLHRLLSGADGGVPVPARVAGRL